MTGSRGFTLLELLIGMTLLGFILALLFGGFRLAARSWDAVEDRAERGTNEQAGRSVVGRLIANAQPVHLKRGTGTVLAFEGERHALRLIAPLGQIGLRGVELTVEPQERANPSNPSWRLVLRHSSVRYGAEQFVADRSQLEGRILVDGLNEAAFSYFGPENRGDSPQWQDQWQSTDGFPLLIRLRLAPKDSSAVVLDMAPMASGDRLATVRITAGPR